MDAFTDETIPVHQLKRGDLFLPRRASTWQEVKRVDYGASSEVIVTVDGGKVAYMLDEEVVRHSPNTYTEHSDPFVGDQIPLTPTGQMFASAADLDAAIAAGEVRWEFVEEHYNPEPGWTEYEFVNVSPVRVPDGWPVFVRLPLA